MDPKVSTGEDGIKLTTETETLLRDGWALDEKQIGVEKKYYFSTYTKCVDFFLAIWIKCRRTKNFCAATVTYSSVHIHWTSVNDGFMVHYSDEQAKSIGTADENQTQKCIPAPTSQSSPGGDKSELLADVEALLGNGWALDKEKMGVQRTFDFADPADCQDFFTMIAIRSKRKNHHSLMTVKSESVYIHWTTHSLPGLSTKDVFMAQFSGEQARSIGTVDEGKTQKRTAAPTSQI